MSKGIGQLQRRVLWLITEDSVTPDGVPWAWDAEELKEHFDGIPGCRYDLRSVRRAARGLARLGYLLETGGDDGNRPPYAHDWYAWLPSDKGQDFKVRKLTSEDVWGHA